MAVVLWLKVMTDYHWVYDAVCLVKQQMLRYSNGHPRVAVSPTYTLKAFGREMIILPQLLYRGV